MGKKEQRFWIDYGAHLTQFATTFAVVDEECRWADQVIAYFRNEDDAEEFIRAIKDIR